MWPKFAQLAMKAEGFDKLILQNQQCFNGMNEAVAH